jgi:TIGR03009 family protein
MQAQPVQAQPMQTQPLGAQGGISVYQNPASQMAQPAASQAPMSQVPTGTNVGQSVRVATTHPVTAGQSAPASVPLYSPSETNQTPVIVQPGGTAAGSPPGMLHVGRAEPVSNIVPFFLNPTEQRELDEFLVRWERYSAGIKRYDVDFNMFTYIPTSPGVNPNEGHKIAFGNFKYIANPMRFAYVIEGEWRDNKPIKRDGDRNPHIQAEKIIIDDKAVYKYDYNAKTVYQINVPSEMIGKGIADSPLPLIFGAKADDLKRRFSMKIEHLQDGTIRLYARPLLIEDQREFRELEIILDRDLRARGLRQHDINEKGHKTFELIGTKINDRLAGIIDDLRTHFTPSTPFGWKREVQDWLPHPPAAAAVPQPQIANPPPQQRHEMPLYQNQHTWQQPILRTSN